MTGTLESDITGTNPTEDPLEITEPGEELITYGIPGLAKDPMAFSLDEDEELQNCQDRAKAYKAMGDDSDTLGAARTLILSLLSQVKITFQAPDDNPSPEANRLAELMNGMVNDMATPWTQVLEEICTAPFYGHSVSEMIFKIRNGPKADAMYSSKYSDQIFGLSDISPRAQVTIAEWVFDRGRAVGFWQEVEGEVGRLYVPLNKCIHVALWSGSRDPTGRSIYRSAKRSNKFRKIFEIWEGIGIERCLDGMPIFRVPPKMLKQTQTNIDNGNTALVKKLAEIGKKIRRDEFSALVVPSDKDERGNSTGFSFEVMTTGTDPGAASVVIERHRNAEALAALVSFLLLGAAGGGANRALSENHSEMLLLALASVLKSVCDALNRQLVAMLARLNGWDPYHLPVATYGKIKPIDFDKLVSSIPGLIASGALTATLDLENKIRQGYELDPIKEG